MGARDGCLKATELCGGSLGDHSKLVQIYHEANHLLVLFQSHPIISTDNHLAGKHIHTFQLYIFTLKPVLLIPSTNKFSLRAGGTVA